MSRLRRTTLAVLVLAAALAIPAAAAERKPASKLAAIVAQAWQRITAPLAALWAKSGGAMDPDGKPLPSPPPPAEGDGGGGMDPNGTP